MTAKLMAQIICNQCGKREDMPYSLISYPIPLGWVRLNSMIEYHQPNGEIYRSDKAGADFCSIDCVDKTSKNTLSNLRKMFKPEKRQDTCATQIIFKE